MGVTQVFFFQAKLFINHLLLLQTKLVKKAFKKNKIRIVSENTRTTFSRKHFSVSSLFSKR